MSKRLTPFEAYKMVEKIALDNGMTVSAWAEKKGVTKGTLSHWKKKRPKTVLLSTLEKLGVTI